jgi:hypothetical protein
MLTATAWNVLLHKGKGTILHAVSCAKWCRHSTCCDAVVELGPRRQVAHGAAAGRLGEGAGHELHDGVVVLRQAAAQRQRRHLQPLRRQRLHRPCRPATGSSITLFAKKRSSLHWTRTTASTRLAGADTHGKRLVGVIGAGGRGRTEHSTAGSAPRVRAPRPRGRAMVRQASASSRDCCAATSSGSPGSCDLQLTALSTVIAAGRCTFRLHKYSWQAASLHTIDVHIKHHTWSAPRAIGVGSSDASSLSTCTGHAHGVTPWALPWILGRLEQRRPPDGVQLQSPCSWRLNDSQRLSDSWHGAIMRSSQVTGSTSRRRRSFANRRTAGRCPMPGGVSSPHAWSGSASASAAPQSTL